MQQWRTPEVNIVFNCITNLFNEISYSFDNLCKSLCRDCCGEISVISWKKDIIILFFVIKIFNIWQFVVNTWFKCFILLMIFFISFSCHCEIFNQKIYWRIQLKYRWEQSCFVKLSCVFLISNVHFCFLKSYNLCTFNLFSQIFCTSRA